MESVFSAVFRFVLAALASWRIAFLVAREQGPWQVFARVRSTAGEGSFGQLLRCVKCVNVWVSIPFAFFVGGETWIELVVVWLALGGVGALIDESTRPPFEWQESRDDGLLHRDADGPDD